MDVYIYIYHDWHKVMAFTSPSAVYLISDCMPLCNISKCADLITKHQAVRGVLRVIHLLVCGECGCMFAREMLMPVCLQIAMVRRSPIRCTGWDYETQKSIFAHVSPDLELSSRLTTVLYMTGEIIFTWKHIVLRNIEEKKARLQWKENNFFLQPL